MSYGNDEKLSGKLLVVKQNPLNSAKFETTTMEYKLLLASLSKIHPGDSLLKTIKFKADEFCQLIGYDRKKIGSMYPYISRSCDRLMSRVVTVNTDDGWIKFNWVKRIKYIKSKAEINLQFHEDLEPFLIFWIENEGYTKYLLENVTKMKSKYAIRVYELLKQYEIIGVRTFTISELRELLGVEERLYEKITHFRTKVITPAHKEVNEKSDIRFEFEEIQEGRKVVAIKFYIKSKNATTKDSDKFKSLDALPKEQLDKLLQLEIHNRYVVLIDIDLIKIHSDKAVLKVLKELKNGIFDKTTVRSPIAFFIWQLEENQ